MKDKPLVHHFMTTCVETISGHKTLKDAMAIMKAKKIRHLPVVIDERVVGIISDRDIKGTAGLEGVDPAKTPVHYFCQHEVYSVSPDRPIDQVALDLAQNHYGSAVVIKGTKIVGILTMVDICKALAYVIEKKF